MLFWSYHPTLLFPPLKIRTWSVWEHQLFLCFLRENRTNPHVYFLTNVLWTPIQLSSIPFLKSKVNPVWLFFFYILPPFFLDFKFGAALLSLLACYYEHIFPIWIENASSCFKSPVMHCNTKKSVMQTSWSALSTNIKRGCLFNLFSIISCLSPPGFKQENKTGYSFIYKIYLLVAGRRSLLSQLDLAIDP